MILVDSSIWIRHLRESSASLSELLITRQVLTHPFIMGELLCGGHLRSRKFFEQFSILPQAEIADHAEVVELVSKHGLHGRGIGWIDANLLAAARLSECRLWTADKSLATVARELGCGFIPA